MQQLQGHVVPVDGVLVLGTSCNAVKGSNDATSSIRSISSVRRGGNGSGDGN
eukprot:CAMPEP_0172378186 /NCGR_PEP_ID=MMETSP1060-20121228/69295_1 /TAXON_ID=37318 /ORGANISM="Pseudo-nitzschia pungens, Strain cf. cingulata" /LENGTH=51 /DNA_ID=CAMNT_0013105901 /DNA_START=593 /DNA_END=748 /DNA_ORIENTATION=-